MYIRYQNDELQEIHMFEKEMLPVHCQAIFEEILGQKLVNILGVLSDEGWEPDWDIILEFSMNSVAIGTKSSHLWSVHHYDRNVHTYGSNFSGDWLYFGTIVDSLQVNDVIEKEFKSFSCSEGKIRLYLDSFELTIFDDGDQLGLRVVRKGDD